MKKKIIAAAGAVILCLSFATTAIAAPLRNGSCGGTGVCGLGIGGGAGLMLDANGNFLDREAFEDKLDALIKAGVINEVDRGAYIAQYEWCAIYGIGSTGGTPVGGGCGAGRGAGWNR
ncbi:MAG: hypothetical protein LBV08_02845 [Clostridiales bacterium]|jgi:hypothetical protein|nr:hypothetical protein [Clostridiales bacterium]